MTSKEIVHIQLEKPNSELVLNFLDESRTRIVS